jgi:hypothetical protein
MRQERNGLVLGAYERVAGRGSRETTPPWDFGAQLLEPDLDGSRPRWRLATRTSRDGPRRHQARDQWSVYVLPRR